MSLTIHQLWSLDFHCSFSMVFWWRKPSSYQPRTAKNLKRTLKRQIPCCSSASKSVKDFQPHSMSMQPQQSILSSTKTPWIRCSGKSWFASINCSPTSNRRWTRHDERCSGKSQWYRSSKGLIARCQLENCRTTGRSEAIHHWSLSALTSTIFSLDWLSSKNGSTKANQLCFGWVASTSPNLFSQAHSRITHAKIINKSIDLLWNLMSQCSSRERRTTSTRSLSWAFIFMWVGLLLAVWIYARYLYNCMNVPQSQIREFFSLSKNLWVSTFFLCSSCWGLNSAHFETHNSLWCRDRARIWVRCTLHGEVSYKVLFNTFDFCFELWVPIVRTLCAATYNSFDSI